MTVEKLKRVMWRVRSKDPRADKVPIWTLKRAIMIECGTSPSTVQINKMAMVRLGWIKTHKNMVYLTGKDLTEDF